MRAEAESLWREHALEAWSNLNAGSPLDLQRVCRRHPALFEARAVDAVEEARRAASGDPRQERALGLLSGHLLEWRLRQATAELDGAIATQEAEAQVEVGGDVLPFRRLTLELAAEPDPQRRRLLQAAGLPVLERLQEPRLARRRRAREEARRLGCDSLVDLAARVRNFDPQGLSRLAEEALEATESEYRALLTPVLEREAGVRAERALPCDLYYAIRGARHERAYAAARLLPSLRETLHGMGIRLETQSGLKIDAEDRPGKSARAFCLPVQVPGDVRVSFRPGAGLLAYDPLYHEMGHAQYYLNIRAREFEFRCLVSTAVSETYATLFEGLTASAAWLRRFAGLPDRQRRELRQMRAFRTLYLLRRFAAQLLYEIEAQELDAGAALAVYRRRLEPALGVPFAEADARAFLSSVDDLLYCAEYVRGWLLEAVLERILRVKYGEGWFDAAGSGAYLLRLWEKGGLTRAEDLLEKLGQKRLSLEPLLRRVRALCEEA